MPDTQILEETQEVQTVRGRKTKHHKTFLDSRQEALSLATLIIDAQEEKSSKKTDRIKATKPHCVTRPPSKRRSQLEERKVALAAKVNRAKRDKAKSRKGRLTGRADGPNDNLHKGKIRKGVIFA